MRLRTQVLAFLLIFALTPLLTAVMMNVPLVFDHLELFYQEAHWQSLRAILYNLDQHLAKCQELVRLLSNIPEPGILLGETDDPKAIDLARVRYTQWINKILPDQFDITQIVFLDNLGQERFWLERDPKTKEWHPTTYSPDRPLDVFINHAYTMKPGDVDRSVIRLNAGTNGGNSGKLMTLYLVGRIFVPTKDQVVPIGAVLMTVDVSDITRFYSQAIWVKNDGSYLETDIQKGLKTQAFQDYPGLDRIVAKGNRGIWSGSNGQQVFWDALFPTETGRLWVGRQVDSSPITGFRNTLALRVLIIVLLLVVMVLGMAHWIAILLERWGKKLTMGIEHMLNGNEAIAFNWHGPQEIKALARDLTDLARAHAGYAKELEASNRYKSEFLANMSHELRTPLNSILLLSKLLTDPEAGLSPEQVKQARVINHAGCDLLALIDNLLDHAKIEARETTVYLEWIDVKMLVEQIMELVQPQFVQKGLTLQLNMSPSAPLRIRTDGDKLRQILKNFIANAIKFTEVGGVDISIDNAGQNSCPLRIAVRDTGIGIPEDKHELIFQPFKQADGSTSRRYGGTGLGLSISRKLARLIGGLIELESRPGFGSAFSLLLPLDPESSQSYPLPISASASPCSIPTVTLETMCQADFSGQWVMLVERNVEALLGLTSLLESWGMRIMVAANREEALECLYDGDACSVVLLGPGISEQECCATIRDIHSESCRISLPIITVSSDADLERGDRYKAIGAAEWLPGPLDVTQLELALERQLGNSAP